MANPLEAGSKHVKNSITYSREHWRSSVAEFGVGFATGTAVRGSLRWGCQTTLSCVGLTNPLVAACIGGVAGAATGATKEYIFKQKIKTKSAEDILDSTKRVRTITKNGVTVVMETVDKKDFFRNEWSDFLARQKHFELREIGKAATKGAVFGTLGGLTGGLGGWFLEANSDAINAAVFEKEGIGGVIGRLARKTPLGQLKDSAQEAIHAISNFQIYPQADEQIAKIGTPITEVAKEVATSASKDIQNAATTIAKIDTTHTPTPTFTPAPTNTFEPTPTHTPTLTPVPTHTIEPTQTPLPTATFTPEATPTLTPIPEIDSAHGMTIKVHSTFIDFDSPPSTQAVVSAAPAIEVTNHQISFVENKPTLAPTETIISAPTAALVAPTELPDVPTEAPPPPSNVIQFPSGMSSEAVPLTETPVGVHSIPANIPMDQFPHQIALPSGSTIWQQSEEIVKMYKPDGYTQADVLAVAKAMAQESGVTVKEWGIVGKTLDTNLKPLTHLATGSALAVLKQRMPLQLAA